MWFINRRRDRRTRAHTKQLCLEVLEQKVMLTAFTVRNITDNGDPNVRDSLSWAIRGANVLGTGGDLQNPVYGSVYSGVPNIYGTQTIRFQLGTSRITITGTLPTITGLLVNINGIDELTNNRTHLQKTSGTVFNGLTYDGDVVAGGRVVIRDLEMSGFQANAIRIQQMGDNDSVEIHNSVLRNNGAAGISVFDAPSGSTGRVDIIGNWIYGNQTGIQLSPPQSQGLPTQISTIRGNTIGETVDGSAAANATGIAFASSAAKYEVRSPKLEFPLEADW
jgi:hypothetical protein